MLSSIKTKLLISGKRPDRPYLYDLSDHGWGSNNRISELRDIAVDNKDKIQYNPTYHTSLTSKFC